MASSYRSVLTWAQCAALALQVLAIVAVILSPAKAARAQAAAVVRDHDGVLEPNEVPDPRIIYGRNPPPAGVPLRAQKSACVAARSKKRPPPAIELSPDPQREAGVVRGTLSGECITAAGVYIGERLEGRIPVQTKSAREMFPFSFALPEGSRAEVRVSTIDGARHVFPVR